MDCKCRCPRGVEYIKTTLIAKTGGGAEVPCGGVLSAHAIKEQLDKLLNKVNAVTCPYRHGQKVTDRVLTELSNRQLEVEKALRDMGI